jgi:anti-sigma factor RsiW
MHPTDETLSGYIDADLPAEAQHLVAQHLEDCERCRQLVADLEQLRGVASTLEWREPPASAWQGVEDRLGRERDGSGAESGSAWWLRPPARWLAAAAAVLIVASVGFNLARFANHRPSSQVADGRVGTDVLSEADLQRSEANYAAAIQGLERIADQHVETLDPATAVTLKTNLAVIDRAIDSSRTALKNQPDNEPAQQSLIEGFKAKVSLLQDAVALINLMNEMRKGNDAGAAKILSGANQHS